MICYFLTVGNFQIIGDHPLFFKRIHKSSRWLSDVAAVAKKSISISYYFAFVLRIINVFVFCLLWIYKASRSILLTLAVAPILLLRYLYIMISETIIAFTKVVFAKSLSFIKPHG
jgi:predicted neutral ceramidase superfamily lipid hydrolase